MHVYMCLYVCVHVPWQRHIDYHLIDSILVGKVEGLKDYRAEPGCDDF